MVFIPANLSPLISRKSFIVELIKLLEKNRTNIGNRDNSLTLKDFINKVIVKAHVKATTIFLTPYPRLSLIFLLKIFIPLV